MTNKFTDIVDVYLLNFEKYSVGNVVFDCDIGELIFCKTKTPLIIIHGIFIHPQFREKGICTVFLCYLVDCLCLHKFKMLYVQSVLSKILYDYLLRFKYKNIKFKLNKKGFYLHL